MRMDFDAVGRWQSRQRSLPLSILLIWLILLPGWIFSGQAGSPAYLTPEQRSVLERISADSLRGHLSFLASNSLEGRDTPSPGLQTAAEYIAAQFRRAGLETTSDNSYFQAAPWFVRIPSDTGFLLTITTREGTISVPPGGISMREGARIDLSDIPLLKIRFDLAGMTETSSLERKAVITEYPAPVRDLDQVQQLIARRQQFNARMNTLKPAAILVVSRTTRTDTGFFARPQLREPEAPAAEQRGPLTISLADPAAARIYDSLADGAADTRLSLHMADPVEKSIVLRNVIGVLRGSDEALRDTCVVVPAHYDHLGVRPNTEGDKIWNGANDDGSGTVSVVELASALSALRPHPKRSIVFAAWFGEEKGLLGSRYYARHPLFPIEKTVAMINLEQLGRTDSEEGVQLNIASLTGWNCQGSPQRIIDCQSSPVQI